MRTMSSLYFILFCFSIHFISIDGSWLISCKPCSDILQSCNFCKEKIECYDCVSKLDTSCNKCLNDIFNGQTSLFCDSAVTYQKLACNYYCKPSKAGICNQLNGKCTC